VLEAVRPWHLLPLLPEDWNIGTVTQRCEDKIWAFGFGLGDVTDIFDALPDLKSSL
jgi:hypothetical protein